MTTQPTPNPFPFLVSARKPTAVALAALGVVFAICAVWWGLWGMSPYRAEKAAAEKAADTKSFDRPDAGPEKAAAAATRSPDYLPAGVWAGLMAFACGGAFGWLATREPDPADPGASARLEVLAFGATVGLLTAMLGVAWGVSWWDSLAKWVNDNDRREAKWVFVAVSVFFAGLAVMFVSTQLGRAAQRDNAVVRRVMHGFNAVLHGVLALLLLVGLNIAVFLKVPHTFVANDAAFTGLTAESKTFVRALDRPVHAYLIMPERFAVPMPEVGLRYENLYADARGMLSQLEDESPNFRATFLSPALDKGKINALFAKYPDVDPNQTGILLTAGEDEAVTGFVPAAALVEAVPVDPRRGLFVVVFQGENKVLSEVAYMTDARSKMAVYVTQDHGELAAAPGGPPDRSMAGLVAFLKERKLRVEPLKLDAAKPAIPADAAAVLVAGPRRTIPPADPLVAALTAYLKPAGPDAKPGKLIALLPAFRGPDGKVAPTGLEGLLAEAGVQLDSARLVARPGSLPPFQGQVVPPEYVLADGDPARHPLAPLFEGQWLPKDCRPLRADPQNPAVRVTRLMSTLGNLTTWQETDFNTAPAATFEALKADADGTLIAQKKVSKQPQVIAVAASAVPAGGEPGKPPPDAPRMLIFTTDSVAVDRGAFDFGPPTDRYQLIAGGVDWLREREASIGIRPRAVSAYRLPAIDMQSKLMLLAMITVGLTGLGVAVWYSRRR